MSDDGWNWWEIIDIFTSVDEDLQRTNELLSKQVELMEKQYELVSEYGEGDSTRTEIVREDSIRDASSITDVAISPTGFNQGVTDEAVEIYPASNEDTINIKLKNSALWYEVGSNDETYSLYQYYADDTEILGERQKEPLGLYNDPYRFPQPIIVRNKIIVNVRRQEDAPGPEEYFSKVRYVPISDSLADKLEMVWRSA